MKRFDHLLLFCCLTVLLPLSALPAAEADDAGLSAEQTFAMLEARGDAVLFVDVRDPVEIQFIGATNEVDVNVPFLLVDRKLWLSEKGRFAMPRNPDFLKGIDAALKAKGLDKGATIVTMCRSGSGRGLPSAEYLRRSGYPNSYYVIHGFQGDKVTEGPMKGFRVKNGWQNSGLPWGYALDPGKIYKP
ncbi:MAG TPA: rhodanese-like domain-containing protein [Opitutales bacterium]|nr:rhodanese-like domain-containing protein [Opitutales bacterium]